MLLKVTRLSRRLTNPATAWTKTKEAITTQTRLLRFAWSVGIMSTVVLTGYTVQAMTLQSQQRILNNLDIEIKTIQLAKLKREEKK